MNKDAASMQVVWEADTAAFASRKRAARACAKCRAAKKRCHHTFQRQPEQAAESDGLDRVLPNLTHKEPIRFVGDLNPESILTDLSTNNDKSAQRISRVGTWIRKSSDIEDDMPPEDPSTSPALKTGEKTPLNVEKYGKVDGGRRVLTGHQRNYLQAVGAFRVLPKATQEAFLTTYIACFDGLLPILNGPKLLADYFDGNCSIFLLQAIALVCCKTEEAAPLLRLFDDGPVLDPIPFARSLHTGLDAAMKADLEPDRVTKIQILTLMHLHNDGPGGIEDSSLHLSMAIHDAWTAGLHIQTPGRTAKDQSSMLWWSIWILDKINACLGGRPIVIANRDIDIARPPLEPEVKRSNVINLWLRLGDLLNEVIEFYRPTADQDCTGWETETEFPPYSSLTEGLHMEPLLSSERTILELCYHVIASLSCRAGGPSTASYSRRIAAADSIQRLLCDGKHLEVPPLPLVPYAVGLALTVGYRGLRDNFFEDAERAQNDLAIRCEMLEALSTYWWTADAMAKLGRKALKSLKETGVRRASIANIATAMEGEVAVCKFGPFEGSSIRQPQESTTPLQKGGSTTKSSGGLHVLSDAAAARSGTSKQSPRNSRNRQNFTPLSANTPATSTATKSNTTTPANLFSNSSYAQSYSSVPPTPDMSTNNNNAYPTFNTNRPTRLTTPWAMFNQPMSQQQQQMSFHPTYQGQNSNMDFGQDGGVMYDAQFNDLDNLFEGFFDLSMPTVWQDPVFDDGWGEGYRAAEADYGNNTGDMMVESHHDGKVGGQQMGQGQMSGNGCVQEYPELMQ